VTLVLVYHTEHPGTNIRVASSQRSSRRARTPSGAFSSPPSPRPSAIGVMPIIIASAVISTGRTDETGLQRPRDGSPTLHNARPKLITSTLLAVATPCTDGAGQRRTDRWSGVNRSDDAGKACRQRVMITYGSDQDWKFTTIRK